MRKTLAFRPTAAFQVTLGSASEAFRLRCQAQNLSQGTLGWYRQLLKMFGRFLEDQGIAVVREVTPTLIRQYLERMRARGNSSVTIERAYGGIRCFLGFLSRERMIPQNPIQLVEKPRVERKLIKPLSMDQVQLLLRQPNQKRYDEHRLWTIMVLIFDTGLRISEVIGLRKDAIDFQAGVLSVMGKGGKERQVPFGSNAKRALWSYMARRGDIPGQDLFFVSRFGGRCCRYLLRKEFHRMGLQAGIQGVRVSPHDAPHLRDPIHRERRRRVQPSADSRPLDAGYGEDLRGPGEPRCDGDAPEVQPDGSDGYRAGSQTAGCCAISL